jgi:hypothetical protein
MFLCIGLMAIFCAVTSYSGFPSVGVYFVSWSRCGVSAAGGVVACSGVTVVGFYYLFNCYMFRSCDHLQEEHILLARITQATTEDSAIYLPTLKIISVRGTFVD